MSDINPKEPYVYQPYGMYEAEHWQAGKIYGVAGDYFATIKGVSKKVAEKIVELLKEEQTDEFLEAK